MIIDRKDFTDTTSRSGDPVSPTTLGETIRSSYNTVSQTELSMSVDGAIFDEYERVISEINDVTGRRLFNPLDFRHDRRAAMEKRFQEEVNTLKNEYPELDVMDAATIREKVGQDRATLREQDARVQKGESGFLQGAARLTGSMGAIMSDPPILFSMFFGASAASGLVRTALIESGIAAAVEVPVQGLVQISRQEVGEEANLGEAAANVALAGVGGFVGGAVIKSASIGARGLVKQYRANRKARSAGGDAGADYLDRLHQLEDANPLEDTPRGKVEHQQKYDDAYIRFIDDAYTRSKPRQRAVYRAEQTPDEGTATPTRAARESKPELFTASDKLDAEINTAHIKLTKRESDVDKLETDAEGAQDEIRELQDQIEASPEDADISPLTARVAELDERLRKKDLARVFVKIVEITKEEIAGLERARKALDTDIAKVLHGERVKVQTQQVAEVAEAAGSDGSLGAAVRRTQAYAIDASDSVATSEISEPTLGTRDTTGPSGAAVNEAKAPPDKATQEAIERDFEKQVLKHLAENQQESISVVDELGNVRKIRADKLIEDFADDESFVRELEECITSFLRVGLMTIDKCIRKTRQIKI